MNTELNANKYRFLRELRPFSYSVALITCGLGSLLAYLDGFEQVGRIVLVMAAGFLLQAAVNLVNNFSERDYWSEKSGATAALALHRIRRNNTIGLAFGVIALLIGLYLVSQVGWPLLLLGALGVLGGYGYTGAPINYKARGLGVILVFWLMGVLMVVGSYYAVAGSWSERSLWLSVPVSMLSAALLLSNELRDIAEDRAQGVKTLTVRIGYRPALMLYLFLLLGVYPVCGFFWQQSWLQQGLWLLPSILLLLPIFRALRHGAPLQSLPPWSGRHFMLFGAGLLLSLI